MEAVMLTFVLCLVAPTALAQVLPPIELTMMNQSIDDMFTGCKDKMAAKVENVYLPRELEDANFQNVWKMAESCADANLDKLPNEHKALTKENLQAICVYTNASTKMYSLLNDAVRIGATTYDTSSFKYHALYFWLTTALQVIPKRCETTYRRTGSVFNGKNGTAMRFGIFASTSRSSSVVEYGTETCFHIKTCFGAYIGDYSVAPKEEEVLVPSYEVFRIVNIVEKSYGKLECKKIFVLESEGEKSELNCQAANRNQEVRANFALIVAFQELVPSYELSVMNASIDDELSGCTIKTGNKIISEYFPREIQAEPFRTAWKTADSCAKNKLDRMQSKYKELNINHTRALCAYTKEKPLLYQPLNQALRQGSALYGTPDFPFHTVYFWLTSAIQILQKSCETTYRRTDIEIDGKVNQVMRFGQFASTSRDPMLDFGMTTCFHIRTCRGAYISEYSDFKGEQEVLIPPYETFKIVEIVLGTYQNPVSYGEIKNCYKIFVLESASLYRSKLNCKIANGNGQIKANIPLIICVQIVIGFMWKGFSNTAI
ncbi:hypothetical protein WMY93_014885 [Mugilogobius chulae]|uniref:NAD(P)(+)--arginine ADP-ribosyltransferase n=1 Tax=Mugilogobius chulae TaxID=88201 RepID=A0AAW0NVV7_9GOBI